MLLPFSIAESGWSKLSGGDGAAWVSILYLAVFGTVLAFVFFYEGVSRIGPSRATAFALLVPSSACSAPCSCSGDDRRGHARRRDRDPRRPVARPETIAHAGGPHRGAGWSQTRLRGAMRPPIEERFPAPVGDGRRQRDPGLVLGRRRQLPGRGRRRLGAPHARGGRRDRRRRRRVRLARAPRASRSTRSCAASSGARAARRRPGLDRHREGRRSLGARSSWARSSSTTSRRCEAIRAWSEVVASSGRVPVPDAHAGRAADDAGRADLRGRGRRGRVVPRGAPRVRRRRRHLGRAICLDPGFGFGKTVEQNFELSAGSTGSSRSGGPCSSGLSRKRSLGRILGDPDATTGPLSASLAAAVEAYERGAAIFRVHDVASTSRH
jgi:hypothetical protein